MSNINDVPMLMVLLLFFKVWDLAYRCMYGHTYIHTDSHVTTKIFEVDGVPNFLGHGAPLTCLRVYLRLEHWFNFVDAIL